MDSVAAGEILAMLGPNGAFANGAAYLALGITLFRSVDRWVRKAGMVGHY
jgi:ABC-type lipopolysaccharide export system ATPase subunit